MPDRIDPADFAGLDAVVHGALVEFGPAARDADTVNLEGARRVLDAARTHGARLVFLSTLSAHPDAVSHYGRNKLELERLHAQAQAVEQAEEDAKPELLSRRHPMPTAEVDDDDIEAALEIAPPARTAFAVAKPKKSE